MTSQSLLGEPTETQIEVMREWFLSQFENPVNCLPYESAEGGYQFIWGGPFDARDELEREFSGIACQKAIDKLVDGLEEECDEWSPIPVSDDYDTEFFEAIACNTQAHQNLMHALDEARNLLQLTAGGSQELLQKVVFVNAITVMEAFLSDMLINAVFADKTILRRYVATTADFADKKFPFSKVFECHDAIEKEVRSSLVDTMWHNLPKVGAMYKATLGIEFPEKLDPLHRSIAKRHDLVHRNGMDKKGNAIIVTREDVEKVLVQVKELADHVDSEMELIHGLP